MSQEERMGYIRKKVKEHRPTAVFIDGIGDLTPDFNDIACSQSAIQTLMSMSSINDCAVFFILHTNKNDTNMKGHLGTLATQKCSDIFHVERDNAGIFHVSETDSRNKTIAEFQFIVDKTGMPVYQKT